MPFAALRPLSSLTREQFLQRAFSFERAPLMRERFQMSTHAVFHFA
jgi:hypothetical protein